MSQAHCVLKIKVAKWNLENLENEKNQQKMKQGNMKEVKD